MYIELKTKETYLQKSALLTPQKWMIRDIIDTQIYFNHYIIHLLEINKRDKIHEIPRMESSS